MTPFLDASPAQQAEVFCGMMLCGGGMGAAYDLLAAVRQFGRAGRWTTGALDLLWGIFCAAGIIAAGLQLQTEVFRWYVFAAAAAGVGLYALTIGAVVRWLGRRCMKLSKKVKKGEKRAQYMQENGK